MHSSWEDKLGCLVSFWRTIWTQPHSSFQTLCMFGFFTPLLTLLPPLIHPLGKRLSSVHSGSDDFEFGSSWEGLRRPWGLSRVMSESRARWAGRALGMWQLQAMLLACALLVFPAQAVPRIPCPPWDLCPVTFNTPSESSPGHGRQGLLEEELGKQSWEDGLLKHASMKSDDSYFSLGDTFHLLSLPHPTFMLSSLDQIVPSTYISLLHPTCFCFLFSFQALHHLTLCVLPCVSCIQNHCSDMVTSWTDF